MENGTFAPKEQKKLRFKKSYISKALVWIKGLMCSFQIYPTVSGGQTSILPVNSFLTCSSDDTIRIWNLDNHMAETPFYKSNIYSHVSMCSV